MLAWAMNMGFAAGQASAPIATVSPDQIIIGVGLMLRSIGLIGFWDILTNLHR